MKIQRCTRGLVKSLVGIVLVISFGFATIEAVTAAEDKEHAFAAAAHCIGIVSAVGW